MHSIPWCRLLSLDTIAPFRHTPAMRSLRQTLIRPICTRCRPLPVPTTLRPPHPTVSNRQFDIRQCYLWPRTPMLWPHNQSNEIYSRKTNVKPIGDDDKKKKKNTCPWVVDANLYARFMFLSRTDSTRARHTSCAYAASSSYTQIIKHQNKNGAKIKTNRFHFAALDRRVVQKGARPQTASVQFVHAWIRNDSQDQLAA